MQIFRNDLRVQVLTGVLTAGLMGSVAMAGEVALSTADGEIEIVGNLLDYTDGIYHVKTSIGPIRIAADQVICAGATCPQLTRSLGQTRRVLVNARIGESVQISSGGEKVQVSGRLLGFEGQTYRVETKLGSLTVTAADVECSGPGCPEWVTVPLDQLGDALH